MRRFVRACDAIVLGGLCLLIAGTPLAFGSVHRLAYVGLELAVFALVAVAALKVSIAGPPRANRSVPRVIVLAGLLLAAIGPLQLIPVSPAILERLSPAAHEMLARSLPGWPEAPPYADLATSGVVPGAAAARPQMLLTIAESTRRTGALTEGRTDDRAAALAPSGVVLPTALPLSLAPGRTEQSALKLFAYLAVFFLVLTYPWNGGPAGESEALRTLLRWLAGTAIAIAALALVQRLTWNGRMLWMLVPHDWPSGLPDPRARVCGPFINRNNLAGYLALLLPLVVVAASARSRLAPAEDGVLRRAARWTGVAIVGLALLLSLSRGGWLAAAAAMLALGLLLARRPIAERPAFLRSRRTALAACTAALLVAGTVALLPLGGDDGPNDLDARLAETFSDAASFTQRVAIWRDALTAWRDFPLLGAGLGAWPEIARRYDTSPARDSFAREVHNDYLQLLVEGGWVAGLLAAVLVVAVARELWIGVTKRSARGAPVVAAAVAGLVAAAVHAGLDFDMQIPAIPLVLAILTAAALRPLLPETLPREARTTRLRAAGLAAVATAALVLAVRQPTADDSPAAPASLAEATERIVARPASALAHLRLYDLLGQDGSEPVRLRELEIAHWLAPRHPVPSDALAAERAAAGSTKRALAQLEESVRSAPRIQDHLYLQERFVPWLSAAESSAVERGLRAALPAHPDAPATLAHVLRLRARSGDAADVLLEAAAEERFSARERVGMLIDSADLLLETSEPERAERAMQDALVLAPGSTGVWLRLIAATSAHEGSTTAARPLAERAIARGADASEVWFAVAEAAKRTGELDERQQALERALAVRPALAKGHFELGLVELERGRATRAAGALRRASELAPDDVAIWYHLGRAEQAAYHLGAARRAFERALALDPVHAKASQALAGLDATAVSDRIANRGADAS